MKEPTAEDWVIARLIRAAHGNEVNTRIWTNYDYMRAILFLTKRVGLKRVQEMLVVLREERKTK